MLEELRKQAIERMDVPNIWRYDRYLLRQRKLLEEDQQTKPPDE